MSPTTPTMVRILAPAKLNVFLELLGRRDDGFHELETIMIAINRFDRILVSVSDDDAISVHCAALPHAAGARILYGRSGRLESLPQQEENLAYKAARLFRHEYNISRGFVIDIRKSIPSGAGMGGASSDAAAVLQSLAALSGVDHCDDRLIQLAARLGSDVPFFFGERGHRMTSAIATGRGEQIENLACRTPFHFVVVHPPESVSTAHVYGRCRVPQDPEQSTTIRNAMDGGNAAKLARGLHNRLREPACGISRWVNRVLAAMQRMPFLGSQMTGSGSACFGVCRSARTALGLAKRLRAMELGLAFTARPVVLPSHRWLLS